MKVRIPLVLLMFLPKGIQEKYVQHVWDTKSDQRILQAYHECQEWANLSAVMEDSTVLSKVAERSQIKLDKYILPQLRKRRLRVS